VTRDPETRFHLCCTPLLIPPESGYAEFTPFAKERKTWTVASRDPKS